MDPVKEFPHMEILNTSVRSPSSDTSVSVPSNQFLYNEIPTNFDSKPSS
jgi:hypothetical protein